MTRGMATYPQMLQSNERGPTSLERGVVTTKRFLKNPLAGWRCDRPPPRPTCNPDFRPKRGRKSRRYLFLFFLVLEGRFHIPIGISAIPFALLVEQKTGRLKRIVIRGFYFKNEVLWITMHESTNLLKNFGKNTMRVYVQL